MSENGADRKPEIPETDENRWFINEKIIRQPLTKRQVFRRLLLTAFCAILFGVLSAVCFVVTQPLAQKVFGQGTDETSGQITIPRDELETTPAATEAVTEPETPVETEPMEQLIQSELKKYEYSVEDLDKLYGNLRSIAAEADKSIVTVHSIQREKDWFNNPIETTGQFSGIITARTRGEILVLVPKAAVESADSIEVSFLDGIVREGTIRQSDSLMDLAIVSVSISDLDSAQADKLKPIELGNSYGIKQGDVVVAVGAPAGIVHSSSYGFVSYVVRNVQVIDGSLRLFFTDAGTDVEAGTFLLNTSGQLVGWATDQYTENKDKNMAAVIGISDYKGALELLSNGIPVPYFGVRGQEVSQEMASSGMPKGIYVTECAADSPAYKSGIQPGDVLTWMNGTEIKNMKDFQNQLEALPVGETVQVAVLRSNGRNEYKEIEYQVTIGAR